VRVGGTRFELVTSTMST